MGNTAHKELSKHVYVIHHILLDPKLNDKIMHIYIIHVLFV